MTIDTLTIYGADTKEGLQRCMNNRVLWLFLQSLLSESVVRLLPDGV